MTHSEELDPALKGLVDFDAVKTSLKAGKNDAQVVFWGPEEDIKTALETIEERCQLAFERVPNETRKSFKNGTTVFERVLPGPDRMYPDTDSAPISIKEERIQAAQNQLPIDVSDCLVQMRKWKIPTDTYHYLLKRNLFPLLQKIIKDFNPNPSFVGQLIGQHLKHIEGQIKPSAPFDYERIYLLFEYIKRNTLEKEILKYMLPVVYHYPNMDFDSILTTLEFRRVPKKEILSNIPVLKEKFKEIAHSDNPNSGKAMVLWVMGRLRPLAVGNLDLAELRKNVEKGN